MSSIRKTVKQYASRLLESHAPDKREDLTIPCPIKQKCLMTNRYSNSPLLYGSWTSKDLIEAVESGCQECSVLVVGLAQYEREIGPLDPTEELTWCHGGWEISVTQAAKRRKLEIFAMPGTDSPFSTMPDGVPLQQNTASTGSIENVRAWLTACCKNHKRCRVPNPRFVPRRLVHVSKSPVGYNAAILEPKHVLQSYLCLSHCWGDGDAGWQLTKGNADFKDGKISLPWANLPNTIRDALEYTAILGQEYMWIDSLCIIQDDQDDWGRESGKMAEIYENAFLTICAAASDSSTKGCFSTPQISYQGCMFQYSVDKAPAATSISESRYHTGNIGLETWTSSETLGFQLLRVGGYTRSECCRLDYSILAQTNYRGSATQFRGLQHDIWESPKVKHHQAILSCDEREMAYLWRTIIEEFSPLDLTFEKDKLPAVSGIVKQMQRVRKDAYLAGLWRNTLLTDLAWFRQRQIECANVFPRPQQWRAPTWSWASVNGYVTSWIHHHFYQFARIHEARCQPRGPDHTGEVTGGYIVISSRTIEGSLKKKVVENHFSNSQLEVFVDSERATWDFWPDYDFMSEGPHHVPIGSVLKLLLLAGHGDRTFCLVLRRSGPEPDTYERVALATFGTELTIFDDFPQPMLREFHDAKEQKLKII